MTDPSPEARDQLAVGLSCLMIAYPSVVATQYAWTALIVGASSFAVVLLSWGSVQLLRRWPLVGSPGSVQLLRRWHRRPKGSIPILLSACLMTSLVYLVLTLSGRYPEGMHPLPLLLTPLLLTYQALSLGGIASEDIRKSVSRLTALGSFSTGLLVGIGAVRELLSFGTVFSSPVDLPGTM